MDVDGFGFFEAPHNCPHSVFRYSYRGHGIYLLDINIMSVVRRQLRGK